MTDNKPISITVFGATGFTGQLVTKILLESEEISTRQIKIGLAGRSESRLKQMVQGTERNASLVSYFVASVDNEPSLDAMCRETKVLFNCVGPFSKYGEPVVQSCLRNHCHYLDITGEPAYIQTLIRKYDQEAAEKKLRIVCCCGFDSIPADLGVYYLLQQLPIDDSDAWDSVNSFVGVNGFVKLNMPGLMSYGTYHTVVTSLHNVSIFGSNKKQQQPQQQQQQQQEKKQSKKILKRGIHWDASLNSYMIPFSTSDPTIVKRSALLNGYVQDGKIPFEYAHYLQIEKWYNVALFILVAMILFFFTRFSWGAKFLLSIWRQPGEGPSEEDRKKSSCDITFNGVAKLKSGVQNVVTSCVVNGDPGYDQTAHMVVQSSLCMLDIVDGKVKANTMSKQQFGVLTTASVFGDHIINRLHDHSQVRFFSKRSSFTRKEDSDYDKVRRAAEQYVYLAE